jgi:MFS family permease
MSIALSRISDDVYLSVVYLTMLQAPPYIFTGYILNVFGRRHILGGCLFQGGLSCIFFAFFSDFTKEQNIASSSSPSTFMQIVAFASMLGLTLSFSVIYVFTSELFATTFRGLGFGVTNIGARIGGILAPLIVELQFLGKGTPYIIFGIVALIGGIASLVFLPETKGCGTLETLEDMKKLLSENNTSCSAKKETSYKYIRYANK